MNELTIDGKIYISSKRAAEVTGYAKDYIGQLCREGHVEARMVGRSWYVLESSIRAHRFGGDPHAAPVESATVAREEQAPASPMDTWEKPTYVPEMIPSMPVPVALPVADEIENVATEASAAETLTDMQAAWKEWFAQKQDTLIETPEIIDAREEKYEEEQEIEQNIQAFKDAHQDIEASEHEEHAEAADEEAEPVSIHAMPAEPEEEPEALEQPAYEEIEPESEPVPIHHAPQPVYAAYEREDIVVPTKQERKRAAVQARKARRARAGSGKGSFIVQAVLIAVIVIVVAVTAIGTGYAERFAASNPLLLPVFDFLGGTSTYSK